jgi:hypothetical protein
VAGDWEHWSAAARPGVQAGALFEGDPHRKRDAKGWISANMSAGRSYKPTVDQKPMTQLVDLELVRDVGLPWFGTLERALRFLSENLGSQGAYPPPGQVSG